MQCHDWLPNLRLNSSPTDSISKSHHRQLKHLVSKIEFPTEAPASHRDCPTQATLDLLLKFFFARPRLDRDFRGALGSKRSSKTQPRPGSLSDAPTYPRHLHGAFTISIGLVSLALSSSVLTSLCAGWRGSGPGGTKGTNANSKLLLLYPWR